MQAKAINLITSFLNRNDTKLIIPVYQRNYDWKEENVRQLLDDLKDIIETGKHHFFGVIVYMPNNVTIDSKDCLIIDGQQRLTTVTLLLQALKDVCQNDEIEMRINKCLIYKDNGEEYELKLKPIKSDSEQYSALLNHQENKLDFDSHIVKNYNLAKKIFKGWIEKGTNSEQILNAIEKLQVVGISLTNGEDDPQKIFESINSTGVPLTNSDLIRNYLLITDHDQDRLFNNYWVSIENKLRKNNSNSLLDLFFRQYVIMKRNSTVTERRVYQYFVDIVENNHYTHENALKELLEFANIYADFINPEKSNYNDKIKEYLLDLNRLDQKTCYPFLMHVFSDYHNKVINEETLIRVLHFITIYLIRRAICNASTNSLNGLFAYLYSRVFKVTENKDKYYEAFNKYFFSQNNKNAIPTDQDLKNALINSNLYQNQQLCRLIMLDIENGETKEKLQTNNLTVEHIMPQTLSRSWKEYISDEEHKEYVHTLGNLSLTGYNSEMSNKSFDEKKQILQQNSRISILNKDVIDKDKWTIDDIKSRGNRLADILIRKYKLNQLIDPSIEFERVDKLTLDDPEAAKGRKPVSFTLEASNYSVKTFKGLTLSLVQILDNDNPEVLNNIIGLNWKGKIEKSNINGSTIVRYKKSIDSNVMWHYVEIRDEICVSTGGNAPANMRIFKLLLNAYGINEDEFSIAVRKK